MANYVKVNGLYVKNYEHVVGNDGRDYLVKIEFTKDAANAKAIPNTLISRALMSIRKSLRLVDDAGSYLYTVDTISGDWPTAITTTDKPVAVAPVTNAPKVKVVSVPKVTIDLAWLTSYMMTKGISTTQLARDFGFTGDKIYYGTKIIKNKVRINLDQMNDFCKKHPSARSHYKVD